MPMSKWATASATGASCQLESVTTPFLPCARTHHALHRISAARALNLRNLSAEGRQCGVDGPPRIFVYGTLMPGEPLWPALASFAVAWHEASAAGRLWDTGRGYPGVCFDAAAGAVPGILVSLDPDQVGAAIELLDDIEEEGSLYRRVQVETSGGPAWAYEWLGATAGLAQMPDGWPRRR